MCRPLRRFGVGVAVAFILGWTLPKIISRIMSSRRPELKKSDTSKKSDAAEAGSSEAKGDEKGKAASEVKPPEDSADADESGDEDESSDEAERQRRKAFQRAAALRGDWTGKRLKMVLVVRTDLKMGKGKMCAQCGHAVAGIMEDLVYFDRALLEQWTDNAQPKIAVKIKTQEALIKLRQKARELYLPNYLVMDAGRTQIAAGSLTVLAIGPGPIDLVNQVTGGLSLL